MAIKLLHVSSKKGATLVEQMITSTIFVMAALAVYPAFIAANKNSKQGDSRQLCQRVVQAKLEEYRNGRSVDIGETKELLLDLYKKANPDASGADVDQATEKITADVNDTYFGKLSMSSMSSTSISGNQTSGGFFYSKIRYNLFYPEICNGTSKADLFTREGNNNYKLGIRECIGSNRAWVDTTDANAKVDYCSDSNTTSIDKTVAGQIPGFKLYVKLELSTPWELAINDKEPKLQDKAAQFSDSCPNFGGWSDTKFDDTTKLYDFDGANEGIKVTVTGVIDAATEDNSPDGKRTLAGIKSADQLICSASGVVKPDPYPIRYYLSRLERRIYTVHGAGTNGSDDLFVFDNLYSQGSGSLMLSGIEGFSVHPRNLSIWVLYNGVLARYSNCGGVPIRCSNESGATRGISEDGSDLRPDVQNFEIHPSITSIGINYRTGLVYGFSPGRGDGIIYEISCDSPLSAPLTRIGNYSARALSNCDKSYYGLSKMSFRALDPDSNNDKELYALFMNAADGRSEHAFMSHEGDDIFVLTNDFNSLLGDAYTSSVYRASDANRLLPILRFPLDVYAFSK